MDFTIPEEIQAKLDALDAFIEKEIKPLQAQDDNERFFDHRRENERTDWDNDGQPNEAWEELLREMRRRADAAGHLRYALPKEVGGEGGSNLGMAIIRDHLAAKGLGLHNDLQNESSIVGNFPFVHMLMNFASAEHKEQFLEPSITGKARVAFGLTEPDHGSDATWMETNAVRDGDDWIINGEKMWNTGLHAATHDMIYARTSGKDGDAQGITCFFVPTDAPGFKVERFVWTFNMPTDHAHVSLKNVRVPNSAIFGDEGQGLAVAQTFLHENRIRQAASGVGAGDYCIKESVEYARNRKVFGEPIAMKQAIQFPLAELATECEMTRWLVRKTAWELDKKNHMQVSDAVSMCNYRGNRLACNAADQAIQTHGGMGYSREKPFEHIYRHHRRYRITEGSEEIQLRKIAGHLFGIQGPNKRPM